MTEVAAGLDTTDPPLGDELVPSDDNGGTASTPERARRGQQPRKLIEYGVYLDGAGVRTVGEWEAENARSMMFCDDMQSGDSTRHPLDDVDDGDLIYLTTVEAPGQDAAVGAMLEDAEPSERVAVVQACYRAFTDLDFRTLPLSRIGDVPAHWDRTPTAAPIGRRP